MGSMDETRELLVAILGRLEEMGAELKGLSTRVAGLESRMEGLESRMDRLEQNLSEFRAETTGSLGRIEGRLSHLAESGWSMMKRSIDLSGSKRGDGRLARGS